MLTDVKIKNAKPKEKPYKIYDAEGLFMLIHPNGSRYWRYKYRWAGKEKTLAMGKHPIVTLKDARGKKLEAQRLLDEGIDPSEAKKDKKSQIYSDAENTFSVVARKWFEKERSGWSESHAHKVWRRVEMHILSAIGNVPVRNLKPEDVIACIERIEASGALDIARRSLQSIKSILTFAAVRNMCERTIIMDMEPQVVLQSRQMRNNPHLDEKDLEAFFGKLEHASADLQTKLAMKFAFLTFVRSSELREATWDEFDFDKKQWRIPAERMKMGAPHIVPLSKQAIDVLEELRKITGIFDYAFAQNRNPRKPMSDATLTRMLYRMEYKGKLTLHGIRGTASTILHEHGFPTDHIERQLAHAPRNKIKARYNHADYLSQRTEMMQWWADLLEEKGMKT